LALKLAFREKSILVVGREDADSACWSILPLDDARSDLLYDSFIITPEGLRYPEDEFRLSELVSRGL
jgi:hypothetical protein